MGEVSGQLLVAGAVVAPQGAGVGPVGTSEPFPSLGSLTSKKGSCRTGKNSSPQNLPPSPWESQRPLLDFCGGVTDLPTVEKGVHFGLEQEWVWGAQTG